MQGVSGREEQPPGLLPTGLPALLVVTLRVVGVRSSEVVEVTVSGEGHRVEVEEGNGNVVVNLDGLVCLTLASRWIVKGRTQSLRLA